MEGKKKPMQGKEESKTIDIRSLQNEVIEMRQKIPDAYKRYLDVKYDEFKTNLTNAITERGGLPLPDLEIPEIDLPRFESDHDSDSLKQYINKAQMFVNRFENTNKK